MTTPVYIVGAGGFGREVFGILLELTRIGVMSGVAGFFDDAPSSENIARVHALDSEVLGTVSDVARIRDPFAAVIAIGSPMARRSIARRLEKAPVTYPSIVHPSATLGMCVALAEGVVIAAGARLSTNITIGRHVHVDQNACISCSSCCLLRSISCSSCCIC